MAVRTVPVNQERGDFLGEVCQLLWPPHASARPARGSSGRPGGAELIVLPGWRQPRLLVPSGRRAGMAAVRRYGEPGSVRARIGTRLLAAVIGTGLGGIALRDRLLVEVPAGSPTIQTYLSTTLRQPVQVSMHLGAARANRKPVLQLLTSGGDTIGFAKIGFNALTRQLVRAERTALTGLSGALPGTVLVPHVLGAGRWRDLEVLVLSPLPVWLRRRPLAPGQLATAMTAVAGTAGLRQMPLAGSTYLPRLRQRLSAAGSGRDQAALAGLLSQLTGRAGDRVLSFGASHGDWTQWNMANTGSGLLVWDWERFTDDAPVGFDMLHYWLQARAVDPRRDPARAAGECVRRSAELLAPLGVPPDAARLTALAYLADLSVRYLADRQEEAGARLGAPGRWLLPALAAEMISL